MSGRETLQNAFQDVKGVRELLISMRAEVENQLTRVKVSEFQAAMLDELRGFLRTDCDEMDYRLQNLGGTLAALIALPGADLGD